MKKGNSVTLENGLVFNLVDSVTYGGEKYFAAISDEENDDTIYFFKAVSDETGEALEVIDENDNEKVINALLQHMKDTF